jgi:hypothetical protein
MDVAKRKQVSKSLRWLYTATSLSLIITFALVSPLLQTLMNWNTWTARSLHLFVIRGTMIKSENISKSCSPYDPFKSILLSSQTRRQRCTLKTKISVGKIFRRPHQLIETLSAPSISTREYIELDMGFCRLKKDTEENLLIISFAQNNVDSDCSSWPARHVHNIKETFSFKLGFLVLQLNLNQKIQNAILC